MAINNVSGSNPYVQPQTSGMAEQSSRPETEQNPDATISRTDGTTRDISDQAFQVNITSQAREALRTDQGEMKTRPDQPPPQADRGAETTEPGAGQTPKKIIDLVA